MAPRTQSDALRAEIEALRHEDDEWAELTPVMTEAIADGIVRAQQQTLPDSDPAGLSVHGPGGMRLSARGRVAWLVAFLLAVVAIVWIAGRVTPPQAEPPAVAPPK